MKNKLGISNFQMDTIEKEIVQKKLEVLDEWFTFNSSKLDFDYLKKLHEFLFGDFYYEEDLDTRPMDEQEEQFVNNYLDKIVNICIKTPDDIDSILKIITEIWSFQPFVVGNTRTMLAYLKVINCCFLLGLNINTNINIESNPRIFRKENFVNQERLTKAK